MHRTTNQNHFASGRGFAHIIKKSRSFICGTNQNSVICHVTSSTESLSVATPFGFSTQKSLIKLENKMSDPRKVNLKRRSQRIEERNAKNRRLKAEKRAQELWNWKGSMERCNVRLDELVKNPGLQHVALNIFKNLDPKSLGNCRLVSKQWKDCIDEVKWWWLDQLSNYTDSLKRLKLKFNPSWSFGRYKFEQIEMFIEVMDYVYKNEPLEDLKLFTKFMGDYCIKFKAMLPYYSILGALDSPMHFAAEKNRLDIIEIFARSPMKGRMNIENWIRFPYEDVDSLLSVACAKNQVKVIELFMDLEDDKKVFNELLRSWHDGPATYSLFHKACDSRNVQVVKLFLERAEELNIDLNVRDKYGTTPIMIAKTKEVMELLLNDDRIDAGATDDYGRTVLHHVCVPFRKIPTEEQIADTVGMLLRSPKIHYAKTLSGKTPLHYCRDKEKRIEEILKVAVERNIDVNEVDGDDRTLAHFAFGYGWGRRCHSDYLEPTCRKKEDILTLKDLCPHIDVILKYAKTLGINLEATDFQEQTPLHRLCHELGSRCKTCVGHFEDFLALAKSEYGIEFNLNATDNVGKNPTKYL